MAVGSPQPPSAHRRMDRGTFIMHFDWLSYKTMLLRLGLLTLLGVHVGAVEVPRFLQADECPASTPDVAVGLSILPVIDGNGGDSAWSSATKIPMFKASKVTKEILGYAYIMYDCPSDTWFVKAEQLYPLEPGKCGPGADCDHFVKMNGGGVLANPYDDGVYFPNNMGWELSFPGSRKSVSGDIDLQVHANVFEDGESQTSGTSNGNSCDTINYSCANIDVPTFDPPTASPTAADTLAPSASPSSAPTGTITDSPTTSPTVGATAAPTASPTGTITASPTTSPTVGATLDPTMTPTVGPTLDPTSVPTSPPTKEPLVIADPGPPETGSPTTSPKNPPAGDPAGGGGDPHFKTWSGKKFDFHGECDLVLANIPGFANGLGLRIHIRTTRRRFFSYIERAVLQIGDEVLEFVDKKNWWLNGVLMDSDSAIAGLPIWRFSKAISVRLDKDAKAKIDFFSRGNGMVYVRMDGGSKSEMFEGSLGMIGEWGSGNMVGRDGESIIEDPSQFAREWQVQPAVDGNLFAAHRAPEFPAHCKMPDKVLTPRLGDNRMREAAEKACKDWNEDKDDCIFDVMAMQDLSAAELPFASVH